MRAVHSGRSGVITKQGQHSAWNLMELKSIIKEDDPRPGQEPQSQAEGHIFS